jgi:hypothetical protein
MKHSIVMNQHEQEAYAMFTYFFLQTIAKRNGVVPEYFEQKFSAYLSLPFKSCMQSFIDALEYEGDSPIVNLNHLPKT